MGVKTEEGEFGRVVGGGCAKFQPIKVELKSHKSSLNCNVAVAPSFILKGQCVLRKVELKSVVLTSEKWLNIKKCIIVDTHQFKSPLLPQCRP